MACAVVAPPHKEAPKYAAAHVALLRLADEGVGLAGVTHEDAHRGGQGRQVRHGLARCQGRL